MLAVCTRDAMANNYEGPKEGTARQPSRLQDGVIGNEIQNCNGSAMDPTMEALEGAEEMRYKDDGKVCNGHNMPSEKVPPDISGKESTIDKGGQD